MGNPKASSVAPLNPSVSPGSRELEHDQTADRRVDQPRDFHFAVTWVALFAHLDPIEAVGPSEATARRPQPANPPSTLALVPVVALPLAEQRAEKSSEFGWENEAQETAAWEMVVPKMVRSDSGDFSPAESGRRRLL